MLYTKKEIHSRYTTYCGTLLQLVSVLFFKLPTLKISNILVYLFDILMLEILCVKFLYYQALMPGDVL